MGKRRWKRLRLADLADRETQARLLRQLETAREGNQTPEPGDNNQNAERRETHGRTEH
jgi:hypothetical protein